MANPLNLSFQESTTLMPDFDSNPLTNLDFGNYYGGSTNAIGADASPVNSAAKSAVLVLVVGVTAYIALKKWGK